MALSALALGCFAPLTSSCLPGLPGVGPAPASAPSPAEPWPAPDNAASLGALQRPKAAAAPAVKEPQPGTPLTLPQAINIGLSNEPKTRAAWKRAQAAAAQVGQARSAYLPQLTIGVSGGYDHQTALGGRFVFQQGSVEPFVDLSYLLLDLGTRGARVDAAVAGLAAANWTHNADLQGVILGIASAWYGYASGEALAAAKKADLDAAQTSLQSAQDRHKAGTANLGDVLQAQMALYRARLALQQAQGQVNVLRGALANALGLPSDAAFTTAPLPDNLQAKPLSESAATVLERAMKNRPDLLAARATAAQAWHQAQASRDARWPTLSLSGTANRTYYFPHPNKPYGDSYAATLNLSFPLFTGLNASYDVERTEALARAADADAETLSRQVALQVWTSYQQVKTNAAALADARRVQQSAADWESFARARYAAGVGTILDLITAQSDLATARAQAIAARFSWLQSMVQLARDSGALGRQIIDELSPTAAATAAQAPGAAVGSKTGPAAGDTKEATP